MTVILALDPGSVMSGWCIYDGKIPVLWGKAANAKLLDNSLYHGWTPRVVAIEAVVSYGQGFDKNLRDTIAWAGVFAYVHGGVDAVAGDANGVVWVTRQRVKLHLTGATQGVNDAVIRKALIDRYGGPTSILGHPKCVPCGGKGMVLCLRCNGRKRIKGTQTMCGCVTAGLYGQPPSGHAASGPIPAGRVGCKVCRGTGLSVTEKAGVLHKMTSDAWSALAVAVTAAETSLIEPENGESK